MTHEEAIKVTPVSPEPPTIDRIEHTAPSVLYRNSWRHGWAEGYRAALLRLSAPRLEGAICKCPPNCGCDHHAPPREAITQEKVECGYCRHMVAPRDPYHVHGHNECLCGMTPQHNMFLHEDAQVGSVSVPLSEASGPNAQERSAKDTPSHPPPSSEPETIAQARIDHLATVEVAITDIRRDFGSRFHDCVKSCDRLLAAVVAQQGQEIERLTLELRIYQNGLHVNQPLVDDIERWRVESEAAILKAEARAEAAESPLTAQTPGEETT